MEERDKQLLKMIRKHPEEGMGLLIDEYGGAIKTICSNVLRNYDADIVQDAMQETVKVIAETVHLKEDNVESRIRRGKKKLKADLLRRGVLNE